MGGPPWPPFVESRESAAIQRAATEGRPYNQFIQICHDLIAPMGWTSIRICNNRLS
jgi:hypothetical protein